MKNTKLINIYGAPGAGKSTLAAELYAELSKLGESVELVREVAKSYAWSGKLPTVFEQIYITNEQMLKESALYGKVDWLITDSPIELGDFYCKYYHNCEALNGSWYTEIMRLSNNFIKHKMDIFVPINPEFYNENGRYSSLKESLEIQMQLIEHLKKQGIQIRPLRDILEDIKNV